jgi:hypothetical protein
MISKEKKKKRNDLILLTSLIVIGLIVFLSVNATKQSGGEVHVIVRGEIVESYPLDENRTVELEYNGHNSLVIKDGRAYMRSADCPDKLCVQQRKIGYENETIVCLPHELVIKISGTGQSEMDSVL